MNIKKFPIQAATVVLAISLLAGCKVTNNEVGFTGENGQSVVERESAPVIWGDPDTSVLAGTQYIFQPEAQDSDGDVLEFSIANKPAWATFDKNSGLLQGVPGTQHIGVNGNIVISVSDQNSVVSLASFDIAVQGAGAPADDGVADGGSDAGAGGDVGDGGGDGGGADTGGADTGGSDTGGSDTGGGDTVVLSQPPVISGTPRTSVVVDNFYMFQPKASDPDGDNFSFSVINKPVWATFNTVTGRLQGTPTGEYIGTTRPIDISVTDGMNIVALERFTITIEPVGTVSKALSWTPPTQNEDGTPLTDLAGYRIYYGAAAGEYSDMIEVGAGVSSYVIEDLTPGTYYLAMTSINSLDMESQKTPEINFDL